MRNYFIYLKFYLFKFFKSNYNIKIKGKIIFKVLIKTIHEYLRARTFTEKEPEMLEWIESLSKKTNKNFVFWDIGSNIGIYSLYNAVINPEAIIFSFEPESSSFEALCKNIQINKIQNIKPFQLAISNKSGYDLLKVSSTESGAGASSIDGIYKHYNSKSIFMQGVRTTSLDDLLIDQTFLKPNFIKIDVDGHESDILLGSSKIFEIEDLISIMVELEYKDQNHLRFYIDYFNKYSFDLIKSSEWKDFSNNNTIQNFLFEKK